MSTPPDNDPPEAVGYGRPPKSGQFRKGQSGNPRGRPRKKSNKPVSLAARFPTRDALREEAGRQIAINDANGRQHVTVTQAVIGALALAALRGGVLAQRTYLEHQKAEDERHHRERKESFEFWLDYQKQCRVHIAAARNAGKAEPELLPHPDDVECDWATLGVQFLGPADEEEAAATNWMLEYRNLCFGMSQYIGEEVCMPIVPGDEGKIGPYFALFLIASRYLPPRLRSLRDADAPIASEVMEQRASGGDDLKRRCEDIGLHFVRWKRGLQMPLLPVSKIGLQWPKGVPVTPAPSRAGQKRGTRRRLAAVQSA